MGRHHVRTFAALAQRPASRWASVLSVSSYQRSRGRASFEFVRGASTGSPRATISPPVQPAPTVEQSQLTLDSWVSPGSDVYVNPICSQLDQLLLKCENTDDVLVLLTTHRGVFFVHNLVTALQVLATLSQEAGDDLKTNELLRDPRYNMLSRDLLRFTPKLDFVAMTNVACALWQLGHKHYGLLSRMLRPLLSEPVPDSETLLRCARAYAWAGYQTQHHFYAHCAAALAEAAPDLSPDQLVRACSLLGGAEHYNAPFFQAAEDALLSNGILESKLHTHDVSLVAAAFAAHLRPSHDRLFSCIAEVVEREAAVMAPSDIALCLQSFRRVALCFEGAIHASLAAYDLPLRRAWLLRQRADGIRAADVATVLECAAFFGVRSELTLGALDYLQDRVDDVGERSAINTVFAMAVFGASSTHSQLLLYLMRKIGAGTAWEKQRARVFHLWVCQRLQFPFIDVRLPRRCIDVGLRAWCQHRRGFGCPFPDEVRQIAAELEEMRVRHRTFVPVPNSPYEVDIAVGLRKEALLVVSEVARNTAIAVGSTLLQTRHLKAQGWRAMVIPRAEWLGVVDRPSADRQAYLHSVLGRLQA